MFSVLVIRLRSLRLLRVSGIVMRLRMFLLLITFLKASHSFRNRLLVICKNAYLFATMIMPFRHQLTILSKTDALDEEKWLNMLGTFVKDWFRYESHFVHGRDSLVDILKERGLLSES